MPTQRGFVYLELGINWHELKGIWLSNMIHNADMGSETGSAAWINLFLVKVHLLSIIWFRSLLSTYMYIYIYINVYLNELPNSTDFVMDLDQVAVQPWRIRWKSVT